MSGAPYYIATGDKVRVKGWLAGLVLTVGEHVKDGYFELIHANGNIMPSYYHEGVLERVA